MTKCKALTGSAVKGSKNQSFERSSKPT